MKCAPFPYIIFIVQRCDGRCKRWFHLKCSGLTMEEFEAMKSKEKWKCNRTDCDKPEFAEKLPKDTHVRPPFSDFNSPPSTSKGNTPSLFDLWDSFVYKEQRTFVKVTKEQKTIYWCSLPNALLVYLITAKWKSSYTIHL